jgi:hypothetical protein
MMFRKWAAVAIAAFILSSQARAAGEAKCLNLETLRESYTRDSETIITTGLSDIEGFEKSDLPLEIQHWFLKAILEDEETKIISTKELQNSPIRQKDCKTVIMTDKETDFSGEVSYETTVYDITKSTLTRLTLKGPGGTLEAWSHTPSSRLEVETTSRFELTLSCDEGPNKSYKAKLTLKQATIWGAIEQDVQSEHLADLIDDAQDAADEKLSDCDIVDLRRL